MPDLTVEFGGYLPLLVGAILAEFLGKLSGDIGPHHAFDVPTFQLCLEPLTFKSRERDLICYYMPSSNPYVGPQSVGTGRRQPEISKTAY